MLPSIEQRLAEALKARPDQVAGAIALLDEGASVPFIARYRKEATGGLDDIQLRMLSERLIYLRELEERRATIMRSIEEQGKLTDPLRTQIESALTKQTLEDLYLPYKPKRRTKAQLARLAGLAPLAEALYQNPMLVPEEEARKYINQTADPVEKHVPNEKFALDGAQQILIEGFAEDATLLEKLRQHLTRHGLIVSAVMSGKETEGAKFRDWFAFSESIAHIPSHRALALLRGRNEGILQLSIQCPEELTENPQPSPCLAMVADHTKIRNANRPADAWLSETVRLAWVVKLSLSLEIELMSSLRERASAEAIRVFARNLHDLLLTAPAGARVTMGLDPGIRTGVKVAIVDATGKLLDTTTVYPHEPRNDWDGSLATLGRLCQKHQVELIAIGNGTASRETDKLAGELLRLLYEHNGQKVLKMVVSEAGASVYSASELASAEFPNLDVSLRGAVSIARRLQDPLAELVKIDPKSIGVGQYQHDVDQSQLMRSLSAVVEDCVNAVGVDVNTASAPLLAHISGLNSALAANIVAHRDLHGAFTAREQLKKVPRLGEKTFEQAAGFLRINKGENPLDASAVHPESYPLVEKILIDIGKSAQTIIGDVETIKGIRAEKYADERFGLPTIRDILKELEKPGRDPRPAFQTAHFKEGIEDIKDLTPGMQLEGVITNVTNFGAFVDIGVHQDGLVHISALSETFVKDPHSIVKAGEVVKVKVLEVDIVRRRIALSMRLTDLPTPRSPNHRPNASKAPPPMRPSAQSSPSMGVLAQALLNARKK